MSKSNVEVLRPADEPIPATGSTGGGSVAIGTTMQIEIGNVGRMELQTILDRDATLDEWNATLDKMRMAGERQRDISELASLEANLALQLRNLATAKDRIEIAEADYLVDKTRRGAEKEVWVEKRAALLQDDQQAFQTGGRRGEYKLSQQAKTNVDRMEHEIRRLDDQQATADNERDNALKSSNAERISYRKTADLYAGEIAKLRAKLGMQG